MYVLLKILKSNHKYKRLPGNSTSISMFLPFFWANNNGRRCVTNIAASSFPTNNVHRIFFWQIMFFLLFRNAKIMQPYVQVMQKIFLKNNFLNTVSCCSPFRSICNGIFNSLLRYSTTRCVYICRKYNIICTLAVSNVLRPQGLFMPFSKFQLWI